VEWKELGEVALIQRWASPRPIQKFITEDEDGIPWIKIWDTENGSKYVTQTAQKITQEGAKKSRILEKGDFIMSNSMSYGRPYILDITWAIHDGWASISDFDNYLNSDFLYHYLSSRIVQNYWKSKINSSSVSNLNADIIKALIIPIPSLKRQAEIVRILDQFDALVNDISIGLPAELQARRQQYEYYREQLLTFRPLNPGKDYDMPPQGYIPDNNAPTTPMSGGQSRGIQLIQTAKRLAEYGIIAELPNSIIAFKYI